MTDRMGLVPILNFPTDEIVGTLEWSTSWNSERGPVMAIGDVDIPDDEAISLTITRPEGVKRVGNDSWTFRDGKDPVDLAFVERLPPDSINSISLRSPLLWESMRFLPHLAPGLTWLSIANAGLGDDVLPSIARLTELTFLQTFGNAFTDAGVQQLIALQQLTHLYLEEESLTVAALAFVSNLPSLERLGLQDMSVTDEDLERLRVGLPGVRVSR